MIIDSHCHIHDEKFNADREEVIQRAMDAGISHLVTIGCDILTTERARHMAELYPHIYFSAGFHPHEAKFLSDENFELLTTLANHPKCVAIGECGLDFYYYHSTEQDQRQALIQQIALAKDLKKPLIIHLRDAFLPCVEIFEEHLSEEQKVLIHCFSGTLEEAHIFADMGFYISLSGIVTFKKPGDLLKVAAEIPLERLIVETDSPYLAPHPHRGQRNEPALIRATLDAVVGVRSEGKEQAEAQIYSNTKEFFALE